MLNVEFYMAKMLISTLVFIISFFIMIKKLGYSYKAKGIFLNIINIVLVILLIKFELKYFVIGKCIITSIILLFLICKISYSFDLKKALTYSILYNLVYRGIEFTLNNLIWWYIYIIMKYNLNFEWSIEYEILQIIVCNLLIFLIVCSFNKLKNLSINKKYYLYIAITIIINILILLFLKEASNSIYGYYSLVTDNHIKINQSKLFMPFVNFADFALPNIIVASNIVFILSLIKLLKYTQEKAKIEVLNEKIDMQYNYYLNIKESQERVKRLYHDINNHITNIKVIQNKNDEVDTYIDSINKEIKDFESIYNTGNVILDIILNEKSKLCKKNNIDLLCNIDFSKCNFIEMIDVSSIFSNLIDNAIEACEKIEDKELKKYISIRGTIVKSYYIIQSQNSKINKVISKNSKILTSKKDKYLHGLGIESIKSSIKKYDGELDIQTDENKFKTTIYIPLK